MGRDPSDITSVLLATVAERVATQRLLIDRIEQAERAAEPYAAEAARAALGEIEDAQAAMLGSGATTAKPVNLAQALARAQRLVEPRFRDTATQVVFETQGSEVEVLADLGLLLRALAMILAEACGSGGRELRTLKVSIGQAERPWLWLSSEPLRPGAPASFSSLSAELQAALTRLGARVEWIDLAGAAAGQRSLRVHFAPRETSQTRASAERPQPPKIDSEAVVGRAHAVAATAMEAFLKAESQTRRILVVDDEPALLALFAAILPTIGVEFELAPSAEAALKLVSPNRFNLAIVDKNLPGISGLDLMRKLSDVDPLLGAVMITGYSSAHAISDALEIGVYDFIDKPFPELNILLSRLQVALRRQLLHARVVRLTEQLDEIAAVLPAMRGRIDARLTRIVHLLAPTDAEEQPLRLLALASPAILEMLRAPGTSLPGVLIEATGTDGQLRASLADPKRRPDLVVVEPRLWEGPLAGLVALGRQGDQSAVQVFAVTDDTGLEPAVGALSAGVADYLVAPAVTPQRLMARLQLVVRRLRQHRRDRAIVLELLSVDIDRIEPGTVAGPAADDLAAFEPQLPPRRD